MLIGEYQHTIDEKGRLIIPAKFRESLGDEFFITRGLDGCLFVFPKEEWNQMVQKISSMDLVDFNARGFSRIFFSGAMDTTLDKQGRVLINQTLRDHAKLDKEVVIIGVSSRAEIWSKAKWEAYNAMDDLNFDALAGHLREVGV